MVSQGREGRGAGPERVQGGSQFPSVISSEGIKIGGNIMLSSI